VVLRARVRPPTALGMVLTPKCRWYLRRVRRPPGGYEPFRRDRSGLRLLLPQKRALRRQYHIRERQLARTLDEAARRAGETSEDLVTLLEQRLDALVWRAGFAESVGQARHLVGHNNVTVDGCKVNLPSYRLHPGQTIEVRASRRYKTPFVLAARQAVDTPPPYLEVHPTELRATLIREPRKGDVPELRDVQLVLLR